MMPVAFASLYKFHCHTLQPGEVMAVIVHDMKLLGQTMPDLGVEACKQLVLHQFLAGLPASVS